MIDLADIFQLFPMQPVFTINLLVILFSELMIKLTSLKVPNIDFKKEKKEMKN